jgi:hypothetical protein
VDKLIVDPQLDDELRQRICKELYAGKKIAAVKLYREASQASLADAKRGVDKIEAEVRLSAPDLFVHPQVSSTLGCVHGLVLFAVGITMIWYMWWSGGGSSGVPKANAQRAIHGAVLILFCCNAFIHCTQPKKRWQNWLGILMSITMILLQVEAIYKSFHSS